MRIPLATYRIQFTPGFGFAQAREIIPYLASLGITDLYASPIFRARRGSTHGYDVVDPTALNPELGSEEEFRALVTTLQAHGMGWIQDIVPNHMAYSSENPYLVDVLENGPASRYYLFFDIDWEHPYEGMRGRVLAPFLGSLLGQALEEGEIQIRFDQDGFWITYYDLRLPLRIETYEQILTHRLRRLREALGEEDPDYIKFLGVLYSLKQLPTTREEIPQRYLQIQFIKRILWEIYCENPVVQEFIQSNLRYFNGNRGERSSFDPLERLLGEQFFRLSFWKVATEEINYRRFFNINDLICVRVEEEGIFQETHRLVGEMTARGIFTGLRVDHIDGLYDPTAYLQRLRSLAREAYIVVEKILEPREPLPNFWPIQGTTGYDFLHYVNGLFANRRHSRTLTRIYHEFTGQRIPYSVLFHDKKRLIVEKEMVGDLDNLARYLKRVSARYRHGSDFTLYGLKEALITVITLFPVYRTYASEAHFRIGDKVTIQRTLARAREANPGLTLELDFIERFLLLDFPESVSEEEREEWLHFVKRFQQLTGPVMAKGFEDTTLYIYNRLISLNEVGGDPGSFGVRLQDFHAFLRRRATDWPYSLNATATHDTKRGEDVRARIHVLSEIPEEWEYRVKRWARHNARHKTLVRGEPMPTRNDEYFLYQTLVGTFPFSGEVTPEYRDRIRAYALKAVREAKVHTAWIKPDTAYEEAFLRFVEGVLGDPAFLDDFVPFQQKVAHYGILNSLAQTLLKITAPGVPDFYQGTELWDLSLVDPDNRRPVDFDLRRRLLARIQEAEARGTLLEHLQTLLAHPQDGALKLLVTYRGLQARRRWPGLFLEGRYQPLRAVGPRATHVVAFARVHPAWWAVVVAPRFCTELVEPGDYPLGTDVWKDTRLVLPPEAPGRWEEVLAEGVLESREGLLVGEALRHLPVALLVGPN